MLLLHWFQVIVRKKKASAEPPSNIRPGEEAHWEVVERILFIYAKTNKGIGYVQVSYTVLWDVAKCT